MLQKHTVINHKHLQSSIIHAKVTSLFAIYTPLMMAQDRTESTRVTIRYGSFINQFSLDTIKSIQQLEKADTKISRQNISILFNEISVCIYIYIYIYVYILSSCADSTKFDDSLSASIPITHRPWQIL